MPTTPPDGRILLLAPPDSFSAAYIRRSLELLGISVLVPPGPAAQAFATLDPIEWLSVSACVAIDLGNALFADLAERRPVPFLFVGNEPGAWFPGAYTWLPPPFASFQVIDALNELIAAAARMAETTSPDAPAGDAP